MICNLRTLKLKQLIWTKLNETMLKHGFPKPISKDSRLIAHKLVGTLSKLFMVLGTPLLGWLMRSAPVYSIGVIHSIITPNN